MSIYLAARTFDVSLVDGRYVELYAGNPSTGVLVSRVKFNASSPNLSFVVDDALDYTMVIVGAGPMEIDMYPNAAPPGDKAFSHDFDGSFA